MAAHALFDPEALPFVSTREPWTLCEELAVGGGCLFTFDCSTIPGGYALGGHGQQFPTFSFPLAEHAPRLRRRGLAPVFDWRFSPPV